MGFDWMLEQKLNDPQADREVRAIVEARYRDTVAKRNEWTHPDCQDRWWERPCRL